MSTRVCICPNCKILMTYSPSVKLCPACNHILEGDFTGIAKEFEVEVTGNSPYAQDVKLLKTTPFEKLRISKYEIERAVKWVLFGTVISPMLILFGSWIIANFIGPGALVLGYGSMIAGPVSFLLCVSTGLGIIMGDPRGKTAKKAFEKIWKDALFDAGSASTANQYTGSKKTGYLYRRFLRSVHPLHRNVTEQEITAYIEGLRKIARAYFDERDSCLELGCKNSKGSDFKGQWESCYQLDSSASIVSEDPESATVEGKISIAFDKTCKVSDKETYSLPAAVVHFNVRQRFIKCGDYWTPVDPLPLVTTFQNVNKAFTI